MKKYIKLYEEFTKYTETISSISVTFLDLHQLPLAIREIKNGKNVEHFIYLYDVFAGEVYAYKFNGSQNQSSKYIAYVIDVIFTNEDKTSYMNYINPINIDNPLSSEYEVSGFDWIDTIQDNHFILDKNICHLISDATSLGLNISELYKTSQMIKEIVDLYRSNDFIHKVFKVYTEQIYYSDGILDLSGLANEIMTSMIEHPTITTDLQKLNINLNISDDVRNISDIAKKGNHKLR